MTAQAKAARWAHRAKASTGWAEIGTSSRGPWVTIRVGDGTGRTVARLTADQARELRRGLSRAIRELEREAGT